MATFATYEAEKSAVTIKLRNHNGSGYPFVELDSKF